MHRSAQIKKELEHLAKAHVGDPNTPFAKTPELSPEFSTLLTESIGYACLAAHHII